MSIGGRNGNLDRASVVAVRSRRERRTTRLFSPLEEEGIIVVRCRVQGRREGTNGRTIVATRFLVQNIAGPSNTEGRNLRPLSLFCCLFFIFRIMICAISYTRRIHYTDDSDETYDRLQNLRAMKSLCYL